MQTIRPGAWAWVGLATFVIAADSWLLFVNKFSNKEDYVTMSEVFADAVDHPIKRWPVILAWVVITSHLFKTYLPEELRKLDPITYTAEMLYEIFVADAVEKRNAP
jgi:hypothetical protein